MRPYPVHFVMASREADEFAAREKQSVCTKCALNFTSEAYQTKCDSISTESLVMDLRNLMCNIKEDCISEDGKFINYRKLRISKHFKDYKNFVESLRYLQMDVLKDPEKTALFINIYNGLTIHALVDREALPSSIRDIPQFWKTAAYNIAGLHFSLNDIQHGILRGNRPKPSSTKPTFAENDPRAALSLAALDPRIHFALITGAKSSPAFRVYSGKTLHNDLNAATRSYCNDEVSMFTEVSEIWLPMMLQWYRKDFGFTDVDVIRWVIPYLTKSQQDRAELLLYQLDSIGRVDIKYSPYDWRINTPQSATLHPRPASAELQQDELA